MEHITRRPMFDEGKRIGTSYFVGELELHLPPSGRPEVYIGTETIDAGVLILELPNIVRLFNDPTVQAQILSACANA